MNAVAQCACAAARRLNSPTCVPAATAAAVVPVAVRRCARTATVCPLSAKAAARRVAPSSLCAVQCTLRLSSRSSSSNRNESSINSSSSSSSSEFNGASALARAGGWRLPPVGRAGKGRRRGGVVGVAVRAALKDENPYDVLGVPRNATGKQIKSAFRRAALKYHPDVNKSPNAEAEFMRVKAAYQALTDPSAKASASSASSSRGRPGSSGGSGGYRGSAYQRGGSASSADDWDPATGWSGFSWGGSSASNEPFYGIDDFLRDLQSDLEERRKKGTKPRTLWEELADIGEDLVEFLEKNAPADANATSKGTDEFWRDSQQQSANQKAASSSNSSRGSTTGSSSSSSYRNTNSSSSSSSGGRSNSSGGGGSSQSGARDPDKEIEDELARLKREMGL